MVFIFHRRKVVALVKFTEINLATGLGIPQTQRVGGVGVVAGDNLVVGDREDLFGFYPARFLTFLLNTPAKTHFVARVVAFEFPRVTVFQPVVRRLFLAAINNVLLEHAVVITNTVAASRQSQRCQRVQKAGRQAPETAIAKTRVVFFVDQIFKIQPHTFQRIFDIVINAQR